VDSTVSKNWGDLSSKLTVKIKYDFSLSALSNLGVLVMC
jgi:hypothetical protein